MCRARVRPVGAYKRVRVYFFGYQGVIAAAMSAQGRFAPPSLDPGAVLVDSDNMNDPAVQKLLNPPTAKGGH